MQLYAITDRHLFANREGLLRCVASWASHSVDFVQIREKDLDADALEDLAREVVQSARKTGGQTRILLNGAAEIAAATGCDGVHLPAGLPAEVVARSRSVMHAVSPQPVISISCHTLAEIDRARDAGASLALFAPVFEKRLAAGAIPGQGLASLAHACRRAAPMPVFALGGIDEHNAGSCIEAGAAGVAAIRLFAAGCWLDIR